MKRITPEQLAALQSVPVTATMPNRLGILLGMTRTTQPEVARGTGLTQPTISDITNGKYRDLKFSTVAAIAAYFGVRIEDVFPPRAREESRGADASPSEVGSLA